MPVFHSGHFRVFWDVLLTAADRFDSNTEDNRDIIIISPWISDVTTSVSGWSDSAIASAFNIDSGNIESLSDVLGELVERGYNVTVMTLSTIGKWLPKAINAHLDRERDFMEKAKKKGVNCLLRNNLHMKYVKTPFAVFAGSINISFNGLSGRNQEAADLFFADLHEQDYRQRDLAIENVLVGAKDYFSPRVPITDWTPPIFVSTGTEVSDRQSGLQIEIVYSEHGDDYPLMVADGFRPVGRITGGIDTDEELQSFRAQLANLIWRVANRAMEIWIEEELPMEGYDRDTLLRILFDDELPDDNPDRGEPLPSIAAIHRLLLPDNQQIRECRDSRLGIADNPDHIEKWLSNSNELLDGIEMLNNKLAEKQEITEADIELLSNLTARFDNRMI
jgi:hypothetical protein